MLGRCPPAALRWSRRPVETLSLTVRAMLHAAALGEEGEAAAAMLLAADLENPALARELSLLS